MAEVLKKYGIVILRIFCCIIFISGFIPESNARTSGGMTVDSIVVRPPTCFGDCDGSIRVYYADTLDLHFSWDAFPGNDTSCLENLCGGIYELTISDSSGIIFTDSISVENPDPITFTINSSPTSCPGGCSGSLTVIPGDTSAVYTYQWPGFLSTTNVLNNICQGTYQVFVSNAQGCSVLGSGHVNHVNPFQLSFISTPAACISSCTGSATVTANGTGPFNYQWFTGPIQNTQSAFNLCTGSYQVSVTDSFGCVVTDSVYIDFLPPPPIITTPVSPQCFGGCNGSATATVSATGNFLFEWFTSPPQFDSVATGLCAGNYVVAVINAMNGCQAIDTVVVENPAPAEFTFAVSPSFCNNTCTGTVMVSTSITQVLSYDWSSGSVTDSDSMLCPGIYTVTVTDINGCSSAGSVSVPSQGITYYSQPASCNMLCNGTAGFNFPFESEWNVVWNGMPGLTDTSATDLCEGLYEFTITDTSGCELNGRVEVMASQPILVTSDITQVTCTGDCDGAIEIFVSGNNPFEITWNTIPPQSGPVLAGLCSGNYHYSIVDSLGCTLTDSVEVVAPEQVALTFITISNSCNAVCDASAQVVPSVPGSYTYQWQTNPVQNGPLAGDLCPGFAVVSLTDDNGCISTDSVYIFDVPPVFVSMNITGISCPGSCDGFLGSLVWGGTPGYNYEWSNGFTTPQVLNLCSGVYTVTVTDATGCTGETTAELTDPVPISVVLNVQGTSCSTCNDGSIEALVSGGSPPYVFAWNPGGIGGPVRDNLLPGWYNLCVGDDNSCFVCYDILVSVVSGVHELENASDEVSYELFPNPFSGSSSLKVFMYSSDDISNLKIECFDLSGRIVNNFEIVPVMKDMNSATFTISETSTRSGLYFFRLKLKDSVLLTGKFVVYGNTF